MLALGTETNSCDAGDANACSLLVYKRANSAVGIKSIKIKNVNSWDLTFSDSEICSVKIILDVCPNLASVQFTDSVMSHSLPPHGLQHSRLPCSSPTCGAYSNPYPLSQWCHATISSSVFPFSSCLQSFPASGSIPMSQLFTSGGQSIGVSASTSVLPMNTQDWSPLWWTAWISLHSKGLSRVFSKTTVQKHQFLGTQLSSQPNSHIHTWPLEKP